jgi:hypothetical protein
VRDLADLLVQRGEVLVDRLQARPGGRRLVLVLVLVLVRVSILAGMREPLAGNGHTGGGGAIMLRRWKSVAVEAQRVCRAMHAKARHLHIQKKVELANADPCRRRCAAKSASVQTRSSPPSALPSPRPPHPPRTLDSNASTATPQPWPTKPPKSRPPSRAPRAP